MNKNEKNEKESFFAPYLKKPLIVAAIAIFCCALWGSATPCIKIGYKLMRPDASVASTVLFAGLRFFLAGIFTVLIFSAARRRFLYPRPSNTGRILTVSLFQTVLQYIFFYMGLSLTSGVKGTIASGSGAFFAILIASLVFRQERLGWRKILACVLGFCGIVIINLNGLELTAQLGDLFVIISAIAYATSTVLMKRFSRYEDPVVISGYQFIVGGAVMIIGGLAFGGRVTVNSVPAVLMLVYLALLSAAAYSLWGILLKYNPVSRVSIYNFMTPVFGVLLSWLMLTEASNVKVINVVISLLLVCAGIFLLNFKPAGAAKKSAPPSDGQGADSEDKK